MLPKILIIDDDHDTLDLLELFLYKQYDIITFGYIFKYCF